MAKSHEFGQFCHFLAWRGPEKIRVFGEGEDKFISIGKLPIKTSYIDHVPKVNAK